MANYTLDFIISNCLIPSKIENWTVILDLMDVGLTQIPKNLLQAVVTSMQKNYRGRLYRLYAVNVPWLLRSLYTLAKGMMDEFTAIKMNLYGSTGFEQDLLKLVDADQLEKKYGGTLENK